MAKYSDIKGFTVQTLSTDTVTSQAAGGSWASGGSLNTARTTAMSSGSGNDNAIVAGGYSGSYVSITEEWEVPDFTIKTVTTS